MERQEKSRGKGRNGAINDSTRSVQKQSEGQSVRPYSAATRLVLALMTQKPLVDGTSIRLAEIDDVTIGRGTTRFMLPNGRRMGALVDDEEMSRRHAHLHRSMGRWVIKDLDSKNGTLVNGEATAQSGTALEDGDVLELGSSLFVFRSGDAAAAIASQLPARDADGETVSNRPPIFRTFLVDLEQRLHRLARVAPSQLPVLVRGETGTGKELVARAIHDLSGRRGEFIGVNCGALPASLIESELFGSIRGAFTGASVDRAGLVRAAQGGTLFLDEVGDLPKTAQTALLRVLQEHVVLPLGASRAVEVDIRVVAATNRDINKMVGRDEFRRDLYARLAGFELTLPPLKDRREDIGILVAAILRKLVHESSGVTLHREAARALLGYSYPNNIRELELALRSAVLLAEGGQIRLEHLPEVIQSYQWPAADVFSVEEQALRDKLLKLLRETNGNVSEISRIMSKAPMQIRRWFRRFRIDAASYRRPNS